MKRNDVTFVMPDTQVGVFLERIDFHPNPTYRVYGKTMCFGCEFWCWLDKNTYKIVSTGQATPFCIQCGAGMDLTPVKSEP